MWVDRSENFSGYLQQKYMRALFFRVGDARYSHPMFKEFRLLWSLGWFICSTMSMVNVIFRGVITELLEHTLPCP